jgi:hypothetical protein
VFKQLKNAANYDNGYMADYTGTIPLTALA